jgi:hypothetical protein
MLAVLRGIETLGLSLLWVMLLQKRDAPGVWQIESSVRQKDESQFRLYV